MTSIVTIAGSPSAPSRSAAVLTYVQEIARQRNVGTAVITVRDLNHSALITGDFKDASIQMAQATVAAADGLVIATPVYKAAYSGVLKTFLDVLPPNALAGKVVLPIVTGGAPGHMLALDYALKPVLAALGAWSVLNGVYLIDSQYEYSDGKITRFSDPEAEKRLDDAAFGLFRALQEKEEKTKEIR